MMQKRKMDDIVLPQRKVDALSRIMRKNKEDTLQNSPPKDPLQQGPSYRKYAFWVIILLVLAYAVFAFSTLFEQVTFTITPKVKTIELSGTFTASQNVSDKHILFQMMTIEDSQKTTLAATEVKEVERRASGTVIVYNDFSSQPQRLIKNTRFETSEGLIFRIHESITVPGQKGSGSTKTPGSIEVTLYADEPGEKYNVDLSDFTIPGFKGTPRYDKFYARSKTKMTGGFIGVVKTISESELRRVKEELQNTLKSSLLKKATEQKPESFTLYDSATFFSFEDNPSVAEETNVNKSTVEISERGTLYAIIFDTSTLTRAIVKQFILEALENDNIEIVNLSSLTLTLNKKDELAPRDLKNISFTLEGTAESIWRTDLEALKEVLAGKQTSELKNILAAFPSITRAEITVRPFWKKTFPLKTDEIIIRQAPTPQNP